MYTSAERKNKMVSSSVIREMKAVVDRMCDYLVDLGTKTDIRQQIAQATGTGNPDLRLYARLDIAEFLMYLSSSDGNLTLEETDFIAKVCSLDFSHREIIDYAKENNIYSKDFENKPPTSLILTVWVDNSIYASARERGQLRQLYAQQGGPKAGVSEPIVNTFKYIGAEFIKARSSMMRSEVRDYKIYTNMLENYIADNFMGA